MDHPISEDTLERFLSGRAAREENRAVVAHLLQGCPSCSRTLQSLASLPESGDAYEAALDRLEKALAASLDVAVTVEPRPARRPGRSRHPVPPRGPRRGPPERAWELA